MRFMLGALSGFSIAALGATAAQWYVVDKRLDSLESTEKTLSYVNTKVERAASTLSRVNIKAESATKTLGHVNAKVERLMADVARQPARLHAVIRPYSNGRWFIQNDETHSPLGIQTRIEQDTNCLRIFFDRQYAKVGTIRVGSDDQFAGAVIGNGNLGLASATIFISALVDGKYQRINPADVWKYVEDKRGGNLWVDVTMVRKVNATY